MLTNSQYNEIEKVYEQRRLAARNLKEARTKELHDKFPVIAEIDRRIIDESFEAGKRSLMGDDEALIKLRQSNGQLMDSKRELMVRMGYPADYLDDVFACSKCNDTGFVDGKHCSCFYKTVTDMYFMSPERRELLNRENFDTFNDSLYDKFIIDEVSGDSEYEIMRTSKEKALEFVRYFRKEYSNLLITGGVGAGKTFLANCIAKALLDEGINVLYMPACDMLNVFSKAAFSKGEDARKASDEQELIYSVECLIVDDLGTEGVNSFMISQFFNCLEKRHLAEKHTVITTNLNYIDLEKMYSPRIASRLKGNFELLRMPGGDNRSPI